MWLVIFSEGLIGVFRIWFDPSIAGDHFVHGATFMTMIWILGLSMLVQLYRSAERVTAMQLALVVVIVGVLIAPIQIAAGTFDPILLVFFAPVVIAAALHPARGELLDRGTVSEAAASPVLLALVGLAAVSDAPRRLVAYAAGLMAVVLAVASVYQPTVSAIDPIWSTLAGLWGLAVVAAFEWSVRRSLRDETFVEDPAPTL